MRFFLNYITPKLQTTDHHQSSIILVRCLFHCNSHIIGICPRCIQPSYSGTTWSVFNLDYPVLQHICVYKINLVKNIFTYNILSIGTLTHRAFLILHSKACCGSFIVNCFNSYDVFFLTFTFWKQATLGTDIIFGKAKKSLSTNSGEYVGCLIVTVYVSQRSK